MDVLRAFVTISEVGSFTQAGDLLGRSQPAISLQIKRLEELIGSSLFRRKGQLIELTESGHNLFSYAKRILVLNDEALSSFHHASVSGQLKLGIPSEFATILLPKILSRFAQTYPNVNLEITSDLSRNLLSEAPQKKFDLVLALHDDPKKASSKLVKEEELVWVTSAQHHVHKLDVIPLITAPEGCIYRNRATSILNKAEQPWRITYINPDLTGIQTAIEEGLGVTVLAKGTVPDTLKIVRTSDRFPKLGKIGISLIAKKGKQTEAVELLMDYLKASLA